MLFPKQFQINILFPQEEILAPVRKRREKKKAKGKLNDGQDDEEVSTEKVLGKSFNEISLFGGI